VKQIFRLVHAEARRRAAEACMSAPDGFVVRISEPTRNLEQNAAMWAALGEVSEQVVWHGRNLKP
jgi:NinB protein